eukprot:14679612-Ditylum_brightwellii.AAC.1
MFHHGQPKQVGRGSDGVGILLGPLGGKAWQLASSPDPIRGNLYFITSAYYPDSDRDRNGEEQNQLLDVLRSVYARAPPDAIIISGEDINAKLGKTVL